MHAFNPVTSAIVERLHAIVGAENVSTAEADRKLHDWRARLAQLKSEIEQVERRVAPSGGEGERKARAADAE